MVGTFNSRLTRVIPVFGWLHDHGDKRWPERLVRLAHDTLDACGDIRNLYLKRERRVQANPKRLKWMLEHADELVPADGRRWRELRRRLQDKNRVNEAINILKADKYQNRQYIIEGKTCADCLIECDKALIWIEGKRFDWLSPSTTWDDSRDQLARNVEAAWWLAQGRNKDKDRDREYRVLICHEFPLKHHEAALLDGYRAGTWSAGWPHISASDQRDLAKRIGTLKWSEITSEWPDISLPDGDSHRTLALK